MNKNLVISNEDATITINKNMYPKEVLVQACYVMLDECYFLIDEQKNNYIITLSLKNKKNNLKEKALQFFDELIEAQSYIDQLKRTSEIRQIILEKALLPQNPLEDKEE